jgi:hypothetical protein
MSESLRIGSSPTGNFGTIPRARARGGAEGDSRRPRQPHGRKPRSLIDDAGDDLPKRASSPSRVVPRAATIPKERLALRHKNNLSALGANRLDIVIKQGLSYGAVHVVYEVARMASTSAAEQPLRLAMVRCLTLPCSRYDSRSRYRV